MVRGEKVKIGGKREQAGEMGRESADDKRERNWRGARKETERRIRIKVFGTGFASELYG